MNKKKKIDKLKLISKNKKRNNLLNLLLQKKLKKQMAKLSLTTMMISEIQISVKLKKI